MLGITIDSKLNFKRHIRNMCKVANQKLNALCRISNYIINDQCKLLINAFIKSQFSYCPLIWMFCTRGSNNKINRIHERSLRFITNDYSSNYDELLLNLNEKTTHQRSINTDRSLQISTWLVTRYNKSGFYFKK